MAFTHVLITAVVAFLFTSVVGIWLIPFLRRLKYGQTILEIGPKWHQKKQGTPTMGGIMFIIGITVAVVAGYVSYKFSMPDGASIQKIDNIRLWAGFIMALGYGLVGFLDDYIKVVKKRNLGLTATQKLVGQLFIAFFYLAVIYLAGDTSTIVIIPFLGQIDLGILYYPFAVFIIVGVVNAVNLTDGIDGLASSVTFVVGICFMLIASILMLPEMNILATALAGGCLGFLVWNFYPAKVFMGDTGSLFLGGMVVALGFGIRMPVLLIFVGIIYAVETLSVIMQVTSFKLTGKRIFKMSPIHHHFEMSGWSEVKIVGVFSAVTAIGSAIAIASVIVK